jgi:hypothetical protein
VCGDRINALSAPAETQAYVVELQAEVQSLARARDISDFIT